MDVTGGESDGLDNDDDGNADEATAGEEYDGIDNDLDGTTDESDEADESRYGDGDSLDVGEQIRYRLLNTGLLERNADYGDGNGIQWRAVADNIDILNFVYLDGNGTTLDDDGSGNVVANRSQIRAVLVSLTGVVGRNHPLITEKDMTLSSEIKCRNLGLTAP